MACRAIARTSAWSSTGGPSGRVVGAGHNGGGVRGVVGRGLDDCRRFVVADAAQQGREVTQRGPEVGPVARHQSVTCVDAANGTSCSECHRCDGECADPRSGNDSRCCPHRLPTQWDHSPATNSCVAVAAHGPAPLSVCRLGNVAPAEGCGSG